jgi:hypothetical protein
VTQALHYAWPLPRFEADEFAAAIVQAWKDEGGGNIRIDGNPKGFELVHGDAEWVYIIKFNKVKGEPIIKIYDWHPYWLEKVNIDRKSFKPTPKMIIPFSDIPKGKFMPQGIHTALWGEAPPPSGIAYVRGGMRRYRLGNRSAAAGSVFRISRMRVPPCMRVCRTSAARASPVWRQLEGRED